MTAKRLASTCWPLWVLCVAASFPSGAQEPARPGEASPATEACSCPSCASRQRPLRNYWVNRLKPCLQYSHWGYAEYFEELPLGNSLSENMNRQILNGARGQMVLYRYDFQDEAEPGAEQLNGHGQRRLEDVTRWLQSGLSPLVVEALPGAAELNEARRRHVVQRLAAAGIPLPDDLVVVGRPAARGLSGEEAGVIHENQLRQTRQGGTSTARARGGAGTTAISAAPTRIPETR